MTDANMTLIDIQLEFWKALNLFTVLDSVLNDECEDDPATNSIQLFRDQCQVALTTLTKAVEKLDAMPFALLSKEVPLSAIGTASYDPIAERQEASAALLACGGPP